MKTFFFFGDSITLGVNVPAGRSWVALFAAGAVRAGLPVPPTTFYNLGVRRQSSVDIARRWEQELRCRLTPETELFQIFCFGTVDMAAPAGRTVVPLEQSVDCARSLLLRAAREAPVLLMSAPPVASTAHSDRLAMLARAYREMCAAERIPFMDLFTPLRASSPYMHDMQDGIHPGELGNELIASQLLKHPVVRGWLAPQA